jgi:hypothetical protein
MFSKAFLKRLSPVLAMDNPKLIQAFKMWPFRSNVAALEWSLERIALARESASPYNSHKAGRLFASLWRRILRRGDTQLQSTARPPSKGHYRFLDFIDCQTRGGTQAHGEVILCDVERLLSMWTEYMLLVLAPVQMRRVPTNLNRRLRGLKKSRVKRRARG